MTRHGKPCQRDCAAGFTRCSKHGARLPEAKIKAEQALALARMPAIEALHDIVEQFAENPCAMCGYPIGDAEEKRMVIQAARAVLDRTGMGPHSVIELTKQTDGDIDLALMTEDERGQVLASLAVIREVKAAVRARQNTTAPGSPLLGTSAASLMN